MNNSKCFHDHLISTFPNNQLLCPNNDELKDNLTHLKQDDFKYKNDIFKNLLSKMIDTSILFSNCKEYFKLRKNTISMMKKITKEFDLCDKTFHLALTLLDRISIKLIANKNAIFQIKILAKFCIILATKFLEDKSYKAILLEEKYSKSISSNLVNDENYILQLLDYNLNSTTSYDILTFLISNQKIIFEDEKSIFQKKNKKYSIYHMSIVYINKLVENYITLQMSPLQIAFGVIQIIRKRFGLIPNRNELYNYFNLNLYIDSFNFAYKTFYIIFCNNSKKLIIGKKENIQKSQLENIEYLNNNSEILC